MCGIFGISGHKEAARLAYLGLYALQHRGEESAGIVTHNGKKMFYHKGMGLVGDVFSEQAIRSLKGNVACGHVRYSTTGSSNIKNIQPFFVGHKHGNFVIAHNGNLTNSFQLKDEMERDGSIFQTTMDSEIIIHLLARSKSDAIEKRVTDALKQLEGSFSLLLMVDDLLIAARDPMGWRPLCLGKLDGSYVVASETCAFDLINASYIRDIEPGEVIFIKNDRLTSIKPFQNRRKAFCIFEYIYFSRPDSNIFGHNVYLARRKLGKELASENKIKDADFVMPIPDSGSYAALGYASRAKTAYNYGMIRNHYVGRTFIQPSQFIRDFRVKVKLNPIKDVLRNKNIIIIEDSIVRGTTSKNRVNTLREAGAKKIHMCVSCPPIKYPCFYGIDFPTRRELIAANHSIPWIRDFIGLDSLRYLSLKGMLRAMPIAPDKFCTACFTGNYPAKVPEKLSKKILEKDR